MDGLNILCQGVDALGANVGLLEDAPTLFGSGFGALNGGVCRGLVTGAARLASAVISSSLAVGGDPCMSPAGS